jgi:hypothetical protein
MNEMTENKEQDYAIEKRAEETRNELDIAKASAAARYEIESAIVIAKKMPRNEDAAYSKLMAACKRPVFADDAMYEFPRGGTQISGASVNLAREAARVWGNIRYGLDILRDDEETRMIGGWAWDLETNVKVTAGDDFKKKIQRKVGGQGVKKTEWIDADERELRELTFRRGAILIRNCILQLMPKDFIEDAMTQVDDTLRNSAGKDPDEQKKKLIMAFADLHVTPAMLEEYLGHPLAQCSPAELANLRKVFASIKDGNSTWKEYVKKPDENDGGTMKPGTVSTKKDK